MHDGSTGKRCIWAHPFECAPLELERRFVHACCTCVENQAGCTQPVLAIARANEHGDVDYREVVQLVLVRSYKHPR
eukprot:SAG31_NODE_1020_length_10349_cov_5.621561_8_plen_76_part_00